MNDSKYVFSEYVLHKMHCDIFVILADVHQKKNQISKQQLEVFF